MRKRLKVFSLIWGVSLILGIGPIVGAQETKNEEFTLEEITVTAQKRAENQQKVSIAMESVSGDQIKELGQNDIDQILSNVAGAIVNKAGDGLRVSIRGLSQDSGGNVGVQSSSPTVAVNSDGVFSNRNNTGQLYDMERVEVLYGPQSTLYASNSPGGIVNIITTDPKIDRYAISGSIEYGNFNLLRTEGALNAPINDKMALRIAFTTSAHDAYVDNGSDNEDKKSARLKVLYKPTDKLSFLITGEYSVDNGIMGFAAAVKAFVDQSDVANPWTAASTSQSDPNNQKTKKISGRMDWDLGFGSFTLLPAYTKTDNKTSQRGTSFFTGQEVTTDISQSGYEKGVEGRIASSDGSFLKWIGGFNWYKAEDNFSSAASDGGGEVSQNIDKTHALYGNVTYPVSDQFRVTGGLRFSWDNVNTYELRLPDTNPTVTSFSHNGKDYMAGTEYDLATNSMIYASYTTSYRAQLAQATDINGNPFPPEKLDAFTIGSKNRFLNNKLQLNASGYYYKYKDYLAVDMVPTIYDANSNGVRDADENTGQPDMNAKQTGDLNIMGVDLQTNTVITDKDLLDLSVSYLKTEFTRLSFTYEPITNSLGIANQNLKGAEKTNSPHWTVNAAYTHNFLFEDGGVLAFRFDTRYQSSYFLTWQVKSFDMMTFQASDISKVRTQEAYHLSNVSMIYTNSDGKWSLTGYVKNLEDYAVKKSWISGLMVIGSPRTYGGILSVKF